MDKLAAFVAVIALGGVAWLAFGQDSKDASATSEQVEQLRLEIATQNQRIEKLLAARETQLLPGDGTAGPAGGHGGPVLHAKGDVAAAGTEAANVPIDERVARLEERLHKQDEELATMKKGGAMRAPFPVATLGGGKKLFRSPDDAATALDMSDAQKSDMERVLESAKHDLDRLYDTPNEDGDTLAAFQRDMAEEIKNRKGEQKFSNLMSHIMKQQKFKQSKVPGSDETYAQAERRINKGAMKDIRRGLSPEQQKQWDNSHTGALLPGSGGTTSFSTMVVGEPAGGEIFVGGEVK